MQAVRCKSCHASFGNAGSVGSFYPALRDASLQLDGPACKMTHVRTNKRGQIVRSMVILGDRSTVMDILQRCRRYDPDAAPPMSEVDELVLGGADDLAKELALLGMTLDGGDGPQQKPNEPSPPSAPLPSAPLPSPLQSSAPLSSAPFPSPPQPSPPQPSAPLPLAPQPSLPLPAVPQPADSPQSAPKLRKGAMTRGGVPPLPVADNKSRAVPPIQCRTAAPAASDNLAYAADQEAGVREACRYGAGCYRENPHHRLRWAHPGDADWPQ